MIDRVETTEEYLRMQLKKAGVPEKKIEELVEQLCRLSHDVDVQK